MSFQRTECACVDCAKFCKVQPGPLAPADVPRLKRLLGEAWSRKFVASPGAVVGTREGGPASVFRIGTIAPRADSSGRCVFLDADDRCEIHDVAPYGCAMFDAHMDAGEAARRSHWYLREIQRSPDYAYERGLLPAKDAEFKDALAEAVRLLAGEGNDEPNGQ